jgi:regulator of sirC expression with transglutaminase-like and TPR domain
MEVAARLGLKMAGVNLPAHFMIRPQVRGAACSQQPSSSSSSNSGGSKLLSGVVSAPAHLATAQLLPVQCFTVERTQHECADSWVLLPGCACHVLWMLRT